MKSLPVLEIIGIPRAELPFSRGRPRKKDIMRDFILEQYASQQEKTEIYLTDCCLFPGRCLN